MHEYLGERAKKAAVDKPVDSVENSTVFIGKSHLRQGSCFGAESV